MLLVEHKNRRYALECKFYVQRDIDKTIRIVGILKDRIGCHRSFIVVPYADNGLKIEELPSGIALVSISEVGKEIAGK